MASPIAVDDVQPWGHGLVRPEDVAVDCDHRVFASDASAAVSEILPDGTLRPIGTAGGEPNGINLTCDGVMAIANFGGHALQALDLDSGDLSTLCDSLGTRALKFPNYPVVAKDGTIYCTSSTQSDDYVLAIATGTSDGYIFCTKPDGKSELLVDGIPFPNGLALDPDENYLYCVRTSATDVVRFPVLPDGGLGSQEPFGPPLGERAEYGEDGIRAVWGDQEERTLLTADFPVLARWGMPDGCAFDADGNLWVAVPGQNRISAITPQQNVVVVVDDPDAKVLLAPTNVSFGGPDFRDVYFGSLFAPYVVKGRASIPGVPLAGQRR